jgi:hypothetical protein
MDDFDLPDEDDFLTEFKPQYYGNSSRRSTKRIERLSIKIVDDEAQ